MKPHGKGDSPFIKVPGFQASFIAESFMHSIQYPPRPSRSLHWQALALAAGLVLGGCASAPSTAPEVPAVPSMAQYLKDAGQAAADGQKDRARDLYRAAAKAYPTSKEPWLKLAEDRFEAGDHGQAILAAQEVLQREPGNNVATSILAVSGLRVSTTALAALRQQNASLSGSARTEATGLAFLLRDALGESVLVPRPTAAQTTAAPRVAPAKPKAVARPATPTPAAAPATATTTAPAPAAAMAPTAAMQPVAASADPFSVLKK